MDVGKKWNKLRFISFFLSYISLGDFMQYKVDLPYPEIKVEKKDVNLAKELLSLYAGEVSEDTAVHTYIFQMLLMHENKELKEVFRGIAITEMHHLEILGVLIKKLGLTPLYLSTSQDCIKWFSGSYVSYEKKWKELLLQNIRSEELAIQNYERIISKTNDEQVIHILKRIILDERLHIEIFSKFYQQS